MEASRRSRKNGGPAPGQVLGAAGCRSPDIGGAADHDGAVRPSGWRGFLSGPWLAPLLGLLCFAGTLTNDFTYDDRFLVLHNQRIRHLADLHALWLSDWWKLVDGYPEANPQRDRLYRPITLFTFALNYAVHGYHPVGYHLVNVLLHAAVCWLVWHLGQRLIGDRRVATLAAAIFAVHPVHAEAVASVVGRAELLAALFLLLGLLTFRPDRRPTTWRRALLGAPWFFLATLSKETAVCYPAVALLIARPTSGGGRRGWLQWGAIAGALLLPLATYFPLRYVALEHRLLRPEPVNLLMNPLVVAGALQRVGGALTILGHYTRLLLMPTRLSCDYGLAIVDPQRGPTLMTWLGLATAAGMLIGLIGFLRRGSLWRSIATLTALCLVSYGLVSNTFLLIGVMLAERLMYWISVPAFLMAALGITWFWRRWCGPGQPLADSGRVLRVLGGLLIAALALRCAVRGLEWADNLRLFGTDVATYPQGAHLNNAYAFELMQLADRAVWPEQRAELLRRALHHASKALEIHPGYAEALAYRGQIRARLGEVAAAMVDLETALQLEPFLRTARRALNELVTGHRAEEKLADLERRLAENPQDAGLRVEFGVALLEGGYYQDARVILEQAVEMDPENLEALRSLGKAQLLTQQSEPAIRTLLHVLQLAPDDWEAHANLVKLLSDRDPAAALRHALRACELKADEPRNLINLAEAYLLNGQKDAAVNLYQRLQRGLEPDDPLRPVVSQRLDYLRGGRNRLE